MSSEATEPAYWAAFIPASATTGEGWAVWQVIDVPGFNTPMIIEVYRNQTIAEQVCAVLNLAAWNRSSEKEQAS